MIPIGLVVTDPHHAGLRLVIDVVAGNLAQVCPEELPDPRFLLTSPFVRPDQRPAQRLPTLGNWQAGASLPAEADACDLGRVLACLLQDLANRRTGALPPVLGILFLMSGCRVKRRMILSGKVNQPTLIVNEHRFGARSPHVNSQQLGHCIHSLEVS